MTTSQKEKKFVTTQKSKKIRRIALEGTRLLKEYEITAIVEIVKEIDSLTNLPCKIVSKKIIHQDVELVDYFPLSEVTPEQIAKYRRKFIPSFVLKLDGKFFHTQIPEILNFRYSSILGSNQCAKCKSYFSIRDKNISCERAKNEYNYIEKYPWITTGYETFYTYHDTFVVINCSNCIEHTT